MMDTPGQAFYNRHIAFLEARDIEGLVTTQYAPDAELVGFDFTIKCQDALRKHFEGYLARLGNLHVVSTDRFTETEDTIFFEATFRVSSGEARVYDAFVLRDGKATHHFTGLLGFTPSTDN